MNTTGKTDAELLAMAEALEWAFRSNPYGYMMPLPVVNEKIAELRAAAEKAQGEPVAVVEEFWPDDGGLACLDEIERRAKG
jgi:hypothetical protein